MKKILFILLLIMIFLSGCVIKQVPSNVYFIYYDNGTSIITDKNIFINNNIDISGQINGTKNMNITGCIQYNGGILGTCV